MAWFASRPAARRITCLRSGLPLSPNEERYVLSEAMSSENYGNPWTVRIKGTLDEGRLRAAIQAMCDRHEGRRTGFEAGPDGRFTRYVEARARPSVRWLSMVGAPEAEVRQTIRNWFFERGDLSPPSLTRFLVIRTGADEHLLGNYLHHAVNDGETHPAAVSEIIDRYAGREPAGVAAQYSDFWTGDWRASAAYREGEAFWRDFLGGIEEVGELPPDGGDPAGAAWGGPVRLRMPPELAAAALRGAEAAGVSEFAFYYAVILVLLTRLTGRGRVCSTFQSGGRRAFPGSQGVHGVFSNGLVLATEVDESQSIAELAGRLRGEIRAALAHEAYPYHHVIQATGLRPRFGVNWYPDIALPACPGLEIFQPEMDYGSWEYDLNIRFIRHLASGGVDLVVYFREPAITRARAVAAADQFAALLAAFSADVAAPIRGTSSRSVAPADALPDPDAPLPEGGGELIHAAFLRQARATPEALAIAHRERRWTYAEVERRSRAVAAELRAAGVAPGDRVAILAERGPDLVWSLLAAARLGAVFVLLDSAYPLGRLEALMAIAAPRVLAAAGGDRLDELARRLSDATGVPLLSPGPDTADPDVAGLDAASPDDPAYILFTSGSTGQPKGVAAAHRPLSRFTAWQAETFGFTPADRFSLLAGLSHDPLLRDIFTPLSLGAAIVIPDPEVILSPGALAVWFQDARISVAHLTPALGQVLLAGMGRVPVLPALRHIFWGGELLAPDLVRDAASLAPRARQTNFYGTTETPQAVAMFACDQPAPRRAVPVGKGVNGAQLLVVDAAQRPVGVGEAGEIAVRSNHLSLGYVEAGRVVPAGDRGVDASGHANLYYTGDRGLYLPGGDVLLLGRADDQVKVRGYRVELPEITAALLRHAAVAQAVTIAVEEAVTPRITAFVERRRGRAVSDAELMTFLAASLPAYMLPRAIQVLDALPLSPNGKADRRALLALAKAEPAGRGGPDLSQVRGKSRALIASWTEVLGEVPIGPDTSFAGLGGDSLSYVQVYLATEQVVGVVPSGWHLMSIAELAGAGGQADEVWTLVDTPMLVRAVAILLVVMGHVRFVHYGGGATAALMVVSGFLFGSFQLTETFARRSAAPIVQGLWRLLLPTLLFSIVYFTAKAAFGRDPNLSMLLLDGNFVDYSRLQGPYWGGHALYLWFIYCMLQIMGLLALAALALKPLNAFRLGPLGFAVVMFLAGCLGRFVAPIAFVPGFLSDGAPRLAMVNFLPTTHLATIMLGAMIALSGTPRRKGLVIGALLAYAALTAHFYGLQNGLVILAAGLAILTAPRVPIPRMFIAPVLALSGGSLFIYLTHFPVISLVRALDAPRWPALEVAAAVVGGVGIWVGWVWAMALLARVFHRTPAPLPQPVL